MKKTVHLTILSLLLFTQVIFAQEDFRKASPKPGPAPKIELGKAEQFTLKNGLKIIVVENHKLPKVSFQVFVDVPPILEGENAGYVSMAGQMLSKGTTTRTKSQIDESVDFIGASLASDENGVKGVCLSKHKTKFLEIFSDVLFNPVFPEEEFQKLKKQAISALAQSKDDPNEIADNVGSVLRNGKNHPYGELETEASIQKITIDQCKHFYQTYFKPNISYLIITGDVTLGDVKKFAPKYFGEWKQGEVPKTTFPAPKQPNTTEVDFVDKQGAVQSVINITYPVELKPGTADAIKASVMNTVLGSYFGSRLNQNLREKKAYTYGAFSSMPTDPIISAFEASASVRNEVTDSAIVQFLFELKRLRTEPMEDPELEMVKNVMTGSFARSLEDPETVARFALNTARFNLPADYYQTYLEKLSKVNRQDVMEMAIKYLKPDRAYILVVGNKDEVSPKLAPFAGKEKVKFFDAFGNPVEDQVMVAPSGVTAQSVINDYLAALGGLDKLNAIENVSILMETSLQGITLQIEMNHKAPDKLAMINMMMGNVIGETVYDGVKGVTMQMGQSEPMDEKKLEDMKIDGRLFPERLYEKLGVKTELKGIEAVGDKKAYKVIVEYPSGNKKTYYFDIATSLKIKEVRTEGDVVITSEITEYKEWNGIKFPNSITLSGAMPVPMTMVTKEVEVNGALDDALFKIN